MARPLLIIQKVLGSYGGALRREASKNELLISWLLMSLWYSLALETNLPRLIYFFAPNNVLRRRTHPQDSTRQEVIRSSCQRKAECRRQRSFDSKVDRFQATISCFSPASCSDRYALFATTLLWAAILAETSFFPLQIKHRMISGDKLRKSIVPIVPVGENVHSD